MSAIVDLPNLEQLTPVMVVDRVEPCLAFWSDRLGFTVENQVPGLDGALVFASAKRGTRRSAEAWRSTCASREAT